MSTPLADGASETLGDWVRRAANAMDSAGLHFGHGTAAAIDEACWMAAHVLDLPPDFDNDRFDLTPTAEQRARLASLLEQRIETRRPLAYLIGEAWFAGLRFRVTDDTLVPRSPLGELVVGGLLPWLDLNRPLRVLEVGTGSGCIAAALAWYWPALEIEAVDISEAALAVAADNLRRLGVADRVRLSCSDVYDALGDVRYDLVVSNPPYVPEASMRALPDEYRHEPVGALVAGADGLAIVRRLIAGAADHLAPGGFLLVEVGEAAEAAEHLLADSEAIWLDFEHGGDGVFLLDRAGALAVDTARAVESIPAGDHDED
ncbi:50S ribosomal protein L3 N(5)-glutamine methyltransferase [Wenzhouxiangella sp. XN79A]|uniref:50S ribosomal protein L3 N(5)-glutamine methyltransferase n=1 Tax=Wenzhouxiangella sp. XN79A TaxID=2724193 RepID=UPI00144A5AB1|nr:50S ribosomal protein L3 N(5)-glutamine methyltransferase [Wenzhouxiangella sp. XN79A]NKI35909.1 50S ribosomal protein L3 N(5)-glutamine methyltransferase [Wenzhouxiangella sp. XN79A]